MQTIPSALCTLSRVKSMVWIWRFAPPLTVWNVRYSKVCRPWATTPWMCWGSEVIELAIFACHGNWQCPWAIPSETIDRKLCGSLKASCALQPQYIISHAEIVKHNSNKKLPFVENRDKDIVSRAIHHRDHEINLWKHYLPLHICRSATTLHNTPTTNIARRPAKAM